MEDSQLSKWVVPYFDLMTTFYTPNASGQEHLAGTACSQRLLHTAAFIALADTADEPAMGCDSDRSPTGILRESQWEDDRVVSVYAVDFVSAALLWSARYSVSRRLRHMEMMLGLPALSGWYSNPRTGGR